MENLVVTIDSDEDFDSDTSGITIPYVPVKKEDIVLSKRIKQDDKNIYMKKWMKDTFQKDIISDEPAQPSATAPAPPPPKEVEFVSISSSDEDQAGPSVPRKKIQFKNKEQSDVKKDEPPQDGDSTKDDKGKKNKHDKSKDDKHRDEKTYDDRGNEKKGNDKRKDGRDDRRRNDKKRDDKKKNKDKEKKKTVETSCQTICDTLAKDKQTDPPKTCNSAAQTKRVTMLTQESQTTFAKCKECSGILNIQPSILKKETEVPERVKILIKSKCMKDFVMHCVLYQHILDEEKFIKQLSDRNLDMKYHSGMRTKNAERKKDTKEKIMDFVAAEREQIINLTFHEDVRFKKEVVKMAQEWVKSGGCMVRVDTNRNPFDWITHFIDEALSAMDCSINESKNEMYKEEVNLEVLGGQPMTSIPMDSSVQTNPTECEIDELAALEQEMNTEQPLPSEENQRYTNEDLVRILQDAGVPLNQIETLPATVQRQKESESQVVSSESQHQASSTNNTSTISGTPTISGNSKISVISDVIVASASSGSAANTRNTSGPSAVASSHRETSPNIEPSIVITNPGISGAVTVPVSTITSGVPTMPGHSNIVCPVNSGVPIFVESTLARYSPISPASQMAPPVNSNCSSAPNMPQRVSVRTDLMQNAIPNQVTTQNVQQNWPPHLDPPFERPNIRLGQRRNSVCVSYVQNNIRPELSNWSAQQATAPYPFSNQLSHLNQQSAYQVPPRPIVQGPGHQLQYQFDQQQMIRPAPQQMVVPVPQQMGVSAPQQMGVPVPQQMVVAVPQQMDRPPPQYQYVVQQLQNMQQPHLGIQQQPINQNQVKSPKPRQKRKSPTTPKVPPKRRMSVQQMQQSSPQQQRQPDLQNLQNFVCYTSYSNATPVLNGLLTHTGQHTVNPPSNASNVPARMVPQGQILDGGNRSTTIIPTSIQESAHGNLSFGANAKQSTISAAPAQDAPKTSQTNQLPQVISVTSSSCGISADQPSSSLQHPNNVTVPIYSMNISSTTSSPHGSPNAPLSSPQASSRTSSDSVDSESVRSTKNKNQPRTADKPVGNPQLPEDWLYGPVDSLVEGPVEGSSLTNSPKTCGKKINQKPRVSEEQLNKIKDTTKCTVCITRDINVPATMVCGTCLSASYCSIAHAELDKDHGCGNTNFLNY